MGHLIRRDRERASLSMEQIPLRLDLTPTQYRQLEAGTAWPDWETYERISNLFGWPATYMARSPNG